MPQNSISKELKKPGKSAFFESKAKSPTSFAFLAQNFFYFKSTFSEVQLNEKSITHVFRSLRSRFMHRKLNFKKVRKKAGNSAFEKRQGYFLLRFPT